MRTLSPAVLDHLLRSRDGLRELVAMRVAEDDPLDFKVDIDLHEKNRKAARELRADCAALATAGTGYLVIGIDESRDGRNEADRLVGIERARVAKIKTTPSAQPSSRRSGRTRAQSGPWTSTSSAA